MRLTTENKDKWIHNMLVFLAPVGLIYLTQLQSAFAEGFMLSSFVPTEFTLGAMVLYVVNTAYDLLRKFIKQA